MLLISLRYKELTKEHSAQVPEAKPSSPSETEALLEELQVLKSQNDKNIEEQRQIKQMCTQLKNERDVCSLSLNSVHWTGHTGGEWSLPAGPLHPLKYLPKAIHSNPL